jgi:hypothetical protein
MEISYILSLSNSTPLQIALKLTSCACLDMSAVSTTQNTSECNDKQDSTCDIITVIIKFLGYMATGIKHFR